MNRILIKMHFAILAVALLAGVSGAQGSATWTYTGNLSQARFNAQAALLRNGKVLVVGGQDKLRDPLMVFLSELYDPAGGQWMPSGLTNSVRLNSTATALPNGRVLAAGGCADASCNTALTSAELYDPATGFWSLTGRLLTGRSYHTATLLKNGKVLVAGGCYSVCGIYTLNSAELYDPATGGWSATGSMIAARAEHTATLLPSGKVLVAGGISGANIVSSAEVYDPATGKWSRAGAMISARRFAQAVALRNGKAMVMGGQNYTATLATSEIFNPKTNRWSYAGNMSSPRLYFAAVTLLNGKVLAIGGADPSTILPSADIYDPATGGWSPAGSMNQGRIYFTATTLADGRVLAAAGNVGDDTSELYAP